MRYVSYCKPLIIFIIAISAFQNLYAYSVLTHEALIDANWDNTILPLLILKYPDAGESQLRDAHAYAYGGSVAPDMGYYPFGSVFFTQLVHYVRTGDFVNALLHEAHDINEYAFALGVLCHYNADRYGHPIAINRSVPLVYPKDKDKYGPVVTYEQDPVSHVRMEFGFDVVQTARSVYAQEEYHDFIGFKVSKPVLERAFVKTYGIDLSDLFKDFSLSVETFRWTVKSFIPTITKAAWAAKRVEIRNMNPTITRQKFEYKIKKANYYHQFGKKHKKPGLFPGTLALVIRIVPKIGVLRYLKIKIPGTEAEKLFIRSFDTVSVHYRFSVSELHRNRTCFFPNIDFDTGNDTWPGEYDLADKNYFALLLALKMDKFKKTDNSLKQNILNFYGHCNENLAAMAGPQQWKEIVSALNELKALKATGQSGENQ